jgi:two-component system cell cycle response regulator
MSLRARLTSAVVLAVAVPVVVATIVLLIVLPSSAHHRVVAQVASARAQALAYVQATCATETRLATRLAEAPSRGAGADAAVTAASSQQGSAAALYDAAGRTLASAARAGGQGNELAGLLATAPDCVSAGDPARTSVAGSRVLAARVTRTDGGTAVVGVALDPALAGTGAQTVLAGLRASTGVDVTLAIPSADGGPTTSATTLADTARGQRLATLAVSRASTGDVWQADGQTVASVLLPGGTRLLVSHPSASMGGLIILVLLVALAVLALAVLVGWRAARIVTRPIGELSRAAERVTEGDLDFALPVRGGDEVGRLADAFNTMTEALRRTITDLRTSRDELQRNVSRLGDTLSGTHDLDRILGVIVDTAMVSVRATAGALMLTAASGDVLYLRIGRGLDGRLPSLEPGSTEANRPVRLGWTEGAPGVAARVAVADTAVHGRVGEDGLVTAADEPTAATVLATPLRSGGRVTGVLTLYDRADGQPFDERDLQIVDSFTSQAVTAVDNVLLHQEAQRLSITDGLTGLWNYRYAIIALAREVERATRFHRPLAVLMLDLDRFKRVNDRYGHQRGDAVLLEVADRVRTVVREVDILARYGGEELILVAPETDVAGAETLAAKVREAIRSTPVGQPGEEPVTMTTSVGIAVYPHHGDSARGLLRAADSALYAAKAAGRDCWRIAASPSAAAAQTSGVLPSVDPAVPSAR